MGDYQFERFDAWEKRTAGSLGMGIDQVYPTFARYAENTCLTKSMKSMCVMAGISMQKDMISHLAFLFGPPLMNV